MKIAYLLGVIATLVGGVLRSDASQAVSSDGPAHLVRNINRERDTSGRSMPLGFTAAGRNVFFIADDGLHGRELWCTDGTPGGTRLVRDLEPGPADGLGYDDEFAAIGDTLFFSGPVSAPGLWKSDGTAAGTVSLGLAEGTARQLTAVGGTLFFLAGTDLWKSDGTTAGTVLVDYLARSYGSDLPVPGGLVAVGERLFFRGFDRYHGVELWRSDGQEYSTELVRDIGPDMADGLAARPGDPLYDVAALNGVLYFLADDGATGFELWRSDGSPEGTFRVRDIAPGAAGAFGGDVRYQSFLAVADQTLLFVASDGVSGHELWRSDGTAEGTTLVADLVPGSDGLFDCPPDYCDGPAPVTVVGNEAFFLIARGETTQLWHSDGTAPGTGLVEDALAPAAYGPQPLTSSGEGIYFVREIEEGTELWRRDRGAGASTRLTRLEYIASLHGFAQGVALRAFDRPSGEEPWWSDGTAAGTVLLRDIRSDERGSMPGGFTALGDQVLFAADDGPHGRELWRSDATEAGTVLVADINQGAAAADPRDLTPLGDIAIFSADDGQHGAELWRSDGSPAGTALIADLQPGAGASRPERFTRVDDVLYFFADDGTHGRELWRTDGTTAGTVMVNDLAAGASSGSDTPADPVNGPYTAVLDGRLFFTATDGISGRELWRSDGTAEGTEMVADLTPGPDGSDPVAIIAAGDWVLFRTGRHFGPQLWRTDGTDAGTSLVAELGSADGAPVGIAGQVFFNAHHNDDYTERNGLWRTDGTPDGTGLFMEQASDVLVNPVDAGGLLFGLVNPESYTLFHRPDDPFWLYERAGGTEIWRPDTGTLLFYSARVTDLGAIDDGVLFIVDPRASGASRQMWGSDGTIDGTIELQELPRSTQYHAYAQPAAFTRAGSHVYFAGNNVGSLGSEIWALPLSALPWAQASSPTPTPTATPSTSPATPTLPATTPTATRSGASGGGGGCQVAPATGRNGIPAAVGLALALVLTTLRRRSR